MRITLTQLKVIHIFAKYILLLLHHYYVFLIDYLSFKKVSFFFSLISFLIPSHMMHTITNLKLKDG